MKAAAKCGTRSGYHRHLKNKEKPCVKCADAQRVYDRSRYDQNKEYFKNKNARNDTRENKQARWRKRNAIVKGNKHSSYTLHEVLSTYGDICHICGSKIDLDAPRRATSPNWENGLHLDHVIPISSGGSDSLDNIRPAHALCNLRKGCRILPYADN